MIAPKLTMEAAQQFITKDTTIGDIVTQYPSVTEILLAEGVHCVGCGASYWETIEEGLLNHGKTPEEIQEVVDRLNQAIPNEMNGGALTITDKAAEKLQELLQKQKKTVTGLRIAVIPGGCSGWKYVMEFEEKAGEEDTVIEINGATFYLDQESAGLLKGAKVDYVDSLQDAGFKITNPNATHTCGCGQSFN